MNILFVHQNMPGQFKHLAPALAAKGHAVVFLTRHVRRALPGVRAVTYAEPRPPGEATHPYLQLGEACVRAGQQVVRAILALRNEGFVPDLVIGHPGWGELLYLKDALPRANLLAYAEFGYHAEGWWKAFDPEDGPLSLDARCRERTQALHLLASLEAADHAWTPTHWQKASHPAPFRDKISVVFDGVDTNEVRPDPDARVVLPNGQVLRAGDEVVSYVARELEPTRGFRTAMRALPRILAARPAAQVVIVGGDGPGYGPPPPAPHASWRAAMLAELGGRLPAERVHFVGKMPYAGYLELLRVTAAHLYLTVPFVLGWSCVEALASGALVIGSDTAPVRELIRDGANGLLSDYFDPVALAERTVATLADPARYAPLRAAARATIVAGYGLEDCLAAQLALVDRVMPCA